MGTSSRSRGGTPAPAGAGPRLESANPVTAAPASRRAATASTARRPLLPAGRGRVESPALPSAAGVSGPGSGPDAPPVSPVPEGGAGGGGVGGTASGGGAVPAGWTARAAPSTAVRGTVGA